MAELKAFKNCHIKRNTLYNIVYFECLNYLNCILYRWTYKPFGLNISELSDFSESEDEDPEARRSRIERSASRGSENHIGID